jgi:nitronate monooxygenase
MWPDRRIIDLVGIKYPIIQAPMAGAAKANLAASVSEAGGLGSLACAMLDKEQVRSEIGIIREQTNEPINVNFFCHISPVADELRETAWRERVAHYYSELALDPNAPVSVATRAPFDAAMCDLIVELRPKVVSFHFGLPNHKLVHRVKSAGCLVFSSATTVAGQAASLGRKIGAAEVTRLLATETLEKLRTIGRLSGSDV